MEEVNGISQKPASGLVSLPGYQVTGCPILMVSPKLSEIIGGDWRGSEEIGEKRRDAERKKRSMVYLKSPQAVFFHYRDTRLPGALY